MQYSESKIIDAKAAAGITGETVNKISKLVRSGKLHRANNDHKIWLYEDEVVAYKNHASPYGGLHFGLDENLRPLDMLNSPHGLTNVRRYNTNSKYVVTNKGRIINLTHNSELHPSNAAHGYQQVNIRCGKDQQYFRIQRLVAYLFCDNSKFKEIVHHIDGDITNNDASNLIWLTQEEHNKADSLRREAKQSGNWEKYNAFIAEMQKDNMWTPEQISKGMRCYLVEETPNTVITYLVTNNGHDMLTSGKTIDEIPYEDILGEFHDCGAARR